jgi:hypothetical protein
MSFRTRAGLICKENFGAVPRPTPDSGAHAAGGAGAKGTRVLGTPVRDALSGGAPGA